MKNRIALVVVATSAVLAACNPPDANRTTKAPPGVDRPTAVTQPLTSPSAPAAPAMRDPGPPSANTAAPGTNASVAFAHEANSPPVAPSPPKGGAPDAQSRGVAA